jgi:vanillate/3-O-methylgallate O-demethylase
VWGEPGGAAPNPKVEDHVQTEVTATVAPNPYVDLDE